MSLNSKEKEKILDFYFRCGEQEHIDQGRDLIAANPEAAELYASLEDTLTQLDNIKYEPCPENLAELTIAKLKLAASASQAKLETLLADEHKKAPLQAVTKESSFWRGVRITAAAAMIIAAVGLYYTFAQGTRQRERKLMCASGLGQVGKGLLSYVKDNDRRFPAVAMSQGAPWWKIGSQSEKHESNTRNLWLLVKNDYVEAKHFVCPGRKDCKTLNCSEEELEKYNDFPSRQHISYSFRLMNNKTSRLRKSGDVIVLMADLNPVFENAFDCDMLSQSKDNEFDKISLTGRMRRKMSRNHRGKGQNILLGGGSAAFRNKRYIYDDDIYTVKDVDDYSGCESPSSDDDAFLVP